MNQAEATIIALQTEAGALYVSAMAMQANDKTTTQPYTEDAYLNIAKRLEQIAAEIHARAVIMQP